MVSSSGCGAKTSTRAPGGMTSGPVPGRVPFGVAPRLTAAASRTPRSVARPRRPAGARRVGLRKRSSVTAQQCRLPARGGQARSPWRPGPGNRRGEAARRPRGVAKRPAGGREPHVLGAHSPAPPGNAPCKEPFMARSTPAPDAQHRRQPLVLLAEDDAEFRRLLVSVLEEDGYEVVEAEDGLALLATIEDTLTVRRERPDAFLVVAGGRRRGRRQRGAGRRPGRPGLLLAAARGGGGVARRLRRRYGMVHAREAQFRGRAAEPALSPRRAPHRAAGGASRRAGDRALPLRLRDTHREQ